jgi:hypothetical protein
VSVNFVDRLIQNGTLKFLQQIYKKDTLWKPRDCRIQRTPPSEEAYKEFKNLRKNGNYFMLSEGEKKEKEEKKGRKRREKGRKRREKGRKGEKKGRKRKGKKERENMQIV